MANPAANQDGSHERCPDCREETLHHVRVEIRTESEDPENAAFSREPYRVAVCARCGHETATRMNNM